MKASTQVWLGVALLHKERGINADFPKPDIEARIQHEPWARGITPQTLSAHISGHAVASTAPSPDRDRLLTRTSRGHYRLFRPGDPTHVGRSEGRMTPDADDLPAECRDLLEWYAGDYAVADRASAMDEFVRLMRESRAFEGVDADAYVEQSREGWDEDLPAKPTQRLGKSRRSPLGSSR